MFRTLLRPASRWGRVKSDSEVTCMTTRRPSVSRRFRLLAPLAFVASSCGGQVGGEDVVCETSRGGPRALDQAGALGLSGQDLLDRAAVSTEANVTWADGSTTTITVDVAYSGTVEFQDREWQGEGGTAEIGLGD